MDIKDGMRPQMIHLITQMIQIQNCVEVLLLLLAGNYGKQDDIFSFADDINYNDL